MQPGLVSVMMPAYNADRFIGEAIESVLRQSYADWELLIVDDGSTDGTAAVAGRVRDARVRILSKPNGGESSARNVALDHLRGEYIAFLDADDAYLPDHLSVTVGFLRAHPERDAVYTDGFHIDTEGRRMSTLQSRRRGPFEGRVYDEVVRASDVFGPPMSVVLRHHVVARHGLRYDERIVIGPDWDFFRQFAEVGTFGYLPVLTGLYRVHQANVTARVDLSRRAGFLALCRENAVRAAPFDSCGVDVRAAVFYDLLVNLLRGQDARRDGHVSGRAFTTLPPREQSRLLRLMALEAMAEGGEGGTICAWLHRARALNPSDRRSALAERAFNLVPGACRLVSKARSRLRGRRSGAPFADLHQAQRGTA